MKHKQVRLKDKVKRDKFETKARAAVKLLKRVAAEQEWGVDRRIKFADEMR